jgi:8-oxo-dGTP diphosphatase
MEITSFGLSEIDFDKINYVVMIAEYKGNLVIIKNKNKDLWELPGGKREEGEPILKAASRELYEETGSVIFELVPYGIYLMNGSYGMNFYVYIEEIGPLPDYEIEEIKFCRELPERLGYGDIYYRMSDEWKQTKDKGDLKKYKVRYNDEIISYDF